MPKLTPVDYDPFAQPAPKLVPVDYDPFQQDKGFFQRMGEDIGNRSRMAGEITTATRRGQQSKPEEIFQLTGKVGVGMLGDVLGEGLVSGARGISAITPDFIENPIKQKAQDISSDILNTPVGKMGINALKKGKENWEVFRKNNPRAARNIESSINLATFFTPVGKTSPAKVLGNVVENVGQKSIGAIGTVAKSPVKAAQSISSGMKTMGKGLKARGIEELDDITSSMKSVSSDLYKQSKEAGAILNKNRAVNIVNKMQNKIGVSSSKPVDVRLYGDTISVLDDMKETAKLGGVGLEDLDKYRQTLNDVVSKNYTVMGPNADAKKAIDAIDELDNAIEQLAPIDIIGGDLTAIEALNQGRAQWAKAKKFESIAQVVKNANGDPNKIKTGFQRFLKNKKLTRGFSEQEIEFIKQASKNSAPEFIMKGLGRFGLSPDNVFLPLTTGSLGTLAGGGPLAGALVATGTATRQGYGLMARGKAEKALQAIEKRVIK